jgi:NAD(P)-dependent dehydrogenase (short-subunit alcohol dehydrogenase family)
VSALDGKAAIVTGGSRGIGAAIVRRLAADGAAVLFTYLNDETSAKQVVEELVAAGGRAEAVRADQADVAGLDALFGVAQERFGGLDVLVNNAAINPRHADRGLHRGELRPGAGGEPARAVLSRSSEPVWHCVTTAGSSACPR